MWRQSDFRRAIQQQGCCLCEDKRKRLPRFFRETTKNPGLEDNKHALVQTTYTMVGRLYVDLTICWELLSGLYYQEFEAMLDASDVAIHRPSRVNEGTALISMGLVSNKMLDQWMDKLMDESING